MERLLKILQEGNIDIEGRFLWSSNDTFLVRVLETAERPENPILAVYKPSRGEYPLWDFPAETLAHRETAAFIVSQALGWGLVPPTVYREEAPLGPGSLQLFINHDVEYHYFNFKRKDRQRLQSVVLFDLLVNNADRKAGHILIDENDHIWLIDHGICFHTEDKLRTVLWDFAGQPVPQNLRADIAAFARQLTKRSPLFRLLACHLSQGEIKALKRRAEILTEIERFPSPPADRRPYPWPPI